MDQTPYLPALSAAVAVEGVSALASAVAQAAVVAAALHPPQEEPEPQTKVMQVEHRTAAEQPVAAVPVAPAVTQLAALFRVTEAQVFRRPLQGRPLRGAAAGVAVRVLASLVDQPQQVVVAAPLEPGGPLQ